MAASMRFHSEGTPQGSDLVGEMATVLRVNGMTFEGDRDTVEDRAFGILWCKPDSIGGYSYSEIKPNLAAAIDAARAAGPIAEAVSE